ncbi:MAG: gliding motility-associated C-terminal domain-containing protein [Bacteroidetes bacterium]|nr:gliding motility-associated C-terminal domain-containing protein [Bacteroidota bacterium]
MIGDGFGGRLWYKPTNYAVGPYSAYNLCYANPCDSSTNQLYAWGYNGYLELGLGPTILGTIIPTPVPGMSNLKYCSSGYRMGAIKNDGTGWVWGFGLFAAPTQVISDAKFLDGSTYTVSFVKNDGTVWSVGENLLGSFGNGTFGNSSLTPIQMTGINNAVRVAIGNGTTYTLLSDSTIVSCGNNQNGSLGVGNGTSPDTLYPIIIPNLRNIIDIKAASMAAVALDSNGDVYTWGDGNFIGDGDTTDEYSPKKLSSLSNIVAISGSEDGHHFLALDANKNCYAWGADFNNGQMGIAVLSPLPYVFTPTLVATDVIDIMAGESFSYIVKSDGSLWGTGSSISGWYIGPTNTWSIWLNLNDTMRTSFTQLNPALLPGTCSFEASNAITSPSCSNSNSGIITVNHSSGLPPYQFNIGGVNQSSNVFTGIAVGNYTVTISDANACVTTVTCTVDSVIGGIPTIVVNSPTICIGDSVTLDASGANAYTWTNSSSLNTNNGSSVIASPTTTTIYNVIGTSSVGCSSSTTSTVTVLSAPLALITSSNDTICSGESVTLNATGANTYTWSPAISLNTTSGANVIADPSTTTTYTLTSNDGTCNSSQTIQVAVYDSPIANFTSNFVDSLEVNSTIQLTNTSSNANIIEWQFCDYNTSNNNNIDLILDEVGLCCIELTAKKNNCYDSISKCFVVYEPSYIIIPNVFSPNGDGKNDFYKMDGIGITTFHCEIYNRFGQKLYVWDGINGYWDGKTKTGIAVDGTYYYIINYSAPDLHSKTERGFLTLTR